MCGSIIHLGGGLCWSGQFPPKENLIMEAQEHLTEALGDSYQIDSELDRGGMATVYLAQDLKHKRRVAIKVLRPELAAGLGAERFVREIEISANLAHPHILPLFDSGEADGLLYYVMPYVEGESLQDRLEREGKLPADEAIRLTDQIASALSYAHDHGVVHRDIKPANILLTGDQALVADFGIARALEAASTEGLTFTGLAVGTPAYMSPEQAVGGEGVDARSDVYSLGCVVYEMMTGEAPFVATDPAAMAAKGKVGRGPSLRTTDPSIPVFLDRAVSKALATDPGERFDTASEFAQALTTGTVVAPVRAPGRGRRLTLAGLAAAVVVLVGWGLSQVINTAPRMERLAVLPLANLTNNPAQEYLAAGVHEALISELGRLGLSTISRATMIQYRDTEKGIAEIARELDVDGVIQGSVYLLGDSLEIASQLFDPEERELWAGSFDGALPNIVALYRGFARAIANQVQLSLRPGDEARLEETQAVNPAVYEAYLKGMQILTSLYTSQEDAAAAIEYFTEAVERNPTDALAWAWLAGCYVTLGHGFDPPPGVWPSARDAAERAIRLDSTLAEGWAALADYKAYSERDWFGAEEAFRKANELNPSLAWNHFHYSWFLVLFGRVDEAIAEHRRAHELDPLTPYHLTWAPAVHWASGDFERAYAEAREVVEEHYPDGAVANYVLGQSALGLGLFEEAIAAHEKLTALFPTWNAPLGITYAKAGRREDALRILAEIEALPPSTWTAHSLASLHAVLGNGDEALRWLDYDPPHGWVAWLASSPDPEWEALREDPRLQAMLDRMNLRFDPGARFPTPLPVDRPRSPGSLPPP